MATALAAPASADAGLQAQAAEQTHTTAEVGGMVAASDQLAQCRAIGMDPRVVGKTMHLQQQRLVREVAWRDGLVHGSRAPMIRTPSASPHSPVTTMKAVVGQVR